MLPVLLVLLLMPMLLGREEVEALAPTRLLLGWPVMLYGEDAYELLGMPVVVLREIIDREVVC